MGGLIAIIQVLETCGVGPGAILSLTRSQEYQPNENRLQLSPFFLRIREEKLKTRGRMRVEEHYVSLMRARADGVGTVDFLSKRGVFLPTFLPVVWHGRSRRGVEVK
jgi:hypothetical protein